MKKSDAIVTKPVYSQDDDSPHSEWTRVCEFLSEQDCLKLQNDLWEILVKQINRWNHGKSSSILQEKAQEILRSICFVIEIQLKSYQTQQKAVESLKTQPLEMLFQKGLKLVERKILVARQLQKQIMQHLLDTPNRYYRSTIVHGINGFFKQYCPQFSAHEIHITADYPVYIGRPQLDGIEFIEEYLRCLEVENVFCIQFDSRDIHHLLCGLTKEYDHIPMNLFEPVLLSALGLCILKRSPKQLDLTVEEISHLEQCLSAKSSKELETCLKEALFSLEKEIKLPQHVKHYISLCLPKLALTIQNAVMKRTLDKVFLLPAKPEEEPKMIISYGKRMNDKNYKELVERILQLDSSIDKMIMILQKVHSFADLLDILSDANLNAKEFELFINMVPMPVFIALLAQYPNDDFLNRESEQLLYDALQKRKQRLSQQERQEIERTADNVYNEF